MENMDSPQTMSHRKKTLSKAFEETKTEFNSFQTLSRLSMPNDFAHTFVHTYVEEANQVNSTFSCIPGNTTQKEKCLTPNTISEQSSPGGVRNMGSLKGCVLLMDDLPQHQTGKMSQLNRHCMSRSSSQRRRRRRRQRHSQMFPESRSDCASQVCEAKTPSQNEYLDDLKSEIEELAKMQKKLLKKQKKALRTLKKINAAKSA
jgi:anion-transporting  ArsA/GET3 family ATPase